MRDVSLVVLIIDAKIDNRVTTNEKLIAAVVDEAFKAINPENMVLVINKAYTGYNVTDARDFYMEMRTHVKNCTLPELTEDRILVLPLVEHEPQKYGDFKPTIELE